MGCGSVHHSHLEHLHPRRDGFPLPLTLHRRDRKEICREIIPGLDTTPHQPEIGISISLAEIHQDVG